MNILVIHQYYLMPGQAGGSRFNEFARLWAAAGHHVTVIAGTVDYSTGSTPERYQGRLFTRERDGDVDVLRCYVPPTYSLSYRGRMAAFFGFLLSSSLAALALSRADVVVASSPPLTTALPGWSAANARLRRIPWVFEIRDLWPESAVTTGILRAGAPLTRALYALERAACRTSSRVNVLTPAFRDDLLRRGLAPEDHIVFIPNGADVDLFKPGPRDNELRRQLRWADRFVVLYSGAHGRANAIDQLLEAAALLRDHTDILLATVGDGTERARLQQVSRFRGLTNIEFYGARPKSEMPSFCQRMRRRCRGSTRQSHLPYRLSE